MQLSQASPEPTTGILRLSGEHAHYDSTTARLCGLDEDRDTLTLETLSTQGTDVRTAGDSNPVPLGAWLSAQLTATAKETLVARCTKPCSALVEVSGCDGVLRIAQNETFAQARRDRHNQRNLINAIQMNGELLKILAAKDNADRFEGIADKILAECRRFEFDEAGHGPGRVAETTISGETARRCLEGLSPNAEATTGATVHIALPTALPQSLLNYLATLFLYTRTSVPGAAFHFSTAGNAGLSIRIDDIDRDAADRILGHANPTGDEGGFLNPARLPATTAAFSLRQAERKLSFDFAFMHD